MRIHTKIRPFICVICKKQFATTAQLKTHCSIHKLHDKFGLFRKLYKCPQCNESFTAMQQLDKHLRYVQQITIIYFKIFKLYFSVHLYLAAMSHLNAQNV